ncbi:hypothetical protein Tco_0316337 [Tanacetum coccineum]
MVEEGVLVETTDSGATTSSIGAMTSGAGKSKLGRGVIIHQTTVETVYPNQFLKVVQTVLKEEEASQSAHLSQREWFQLVRLSHINHNLWLLHDHSEFDSTQEFADEIGELRAISGHMLGAAGVQIPEDNLNDLLASREEDETSEFMDLQDLLGSLFVADTGLKNS